MGNKATGGPFAPLVVVVRNIVGDKEFNKLRGKAISLHSQGGGRRHTFATCRSSKQQILKGRCNALVHALIRVDQHS